MTGPEGEINPYASPGAAAQDSPAITGPDAISFAGDINEALIQQATRLDERAVRLGWWVIVCLVLALVGACANFALAGDFSWGLSMSVAFVGGLVGLLEYRGRMRSRPPIAVGPFRGAASPAGIDLHFPTQTLRLEWDALLGQMADADMVLLYSGPHGACFAFPRGAFPSEAAWGGFCELVARKHVPQAGA